MTTRPKILWGICGIGNGHAFRQLPLIEHFAKTCDIMIFGYGNSYDFFAKKYAGSDTVRVAPVAVSFYAHNADGIDFEATLHRPENQQDFGAVNRQAMVEAARFLGKPDLAISDYEPVSAQYAYAYGAPLVTLDQQSKYMTGDFPQRLQGQGYANEVMMLRMFFPKAAQRLACSFFNVAARADADEHVEVLPPILSDAITRIQRAPSTGRPSILLYVSSQQPFMQDTADIIRACKAVPDADFHIFCKDLANGHDANINTYPHGDPRFHDVLRTCNGIVSTAGHSLLSEAMYLGIPVHAVPLPLYEQHMNAHVLNENGFGVSCPAITPESLSAFIDAAPRYAAAIKGDKAVLLRTQGLTPFVARLAAHLKL